MRMYGGSSVWGLVALLGLGCTPSQEARRVALEVEVEAATLAALDNDLGWRVELGAARLAVADLQFSILGEMHAASAWLPSWVLGRAWAHPGHLAGGDVTGELRGEFILDWAQGGQRLGAAELLTGVYEGMNFSFRVAGPGDGLAADDPLLGHTAYVAGTARKGAQEVVFTAQLDVAEGTQMVGAPFELEVERTGQAIVALQFWPMDPVGGGSLFDGIDFAALELDGEVAIGPGDAAHNILRRALQSHVHYAAVDR